MQNTFAQKTDFQFQHLAIENGLADNWVHDILMDSKGIVWFATHDGLSRFDGHHFKNYKVNLKDTSGLQGAVLMNIKEGKNNIYWIACNGMGLTKFDAKNETFTHFKHDPNNEKSIWADATTTIFIDEEERIWVGSFDGGLNLFDEKTETFQRFGVSENFAPDQSFMKNSINEIIADPLDKNKLWLGTHEGIRHFDKTTFEMINYPLMASYPTFTVKMLADSTGNIWVGTEGHGLVQFNSITKQVDFLSEPMQAKSIVRKSVNELWVSTIGKGLGIYNTKEKTWNFLRESDSKSYAILTDDIYGLYLDNEDRLWVRDMTSGVSILNDKRVVFSQPQMDEAVSTTLVNLKKMTFLPDSNELAVASILDNRVFFFQKNKEGYVQNKTFVLTEEKSQVLDLITTSMGQTFALAKTEKDILLFEYAKTNLGFSPVVLEQLEQLDAVDIGYAKLKEDRKGKLWMAFPSGKLLGWDGQSVEEKTVGKFIKSEKGPQIWDIVFDEENQLWAASLTDGLCKLDLEKNEESYFSYEERWFDGWRIQAIEILKNGKIWVGSSASGIYEIDPQELHKDKVVKYNQSTGLLDDKINGLELDEVGNVWIATSRGLIKYDVENQHFLHLGKENGLVNSFLDKGMELLSNGDIFVGQPNGFLVLDPSQMKQSVTPHEVNFSSILVNGEIFKTNQHLNFLNKLTLEPTENYFTIQFSAQYFDEPEKTTYRYFLKNYDRNWNTVSGKEAQAKFTNVPAGNYILQVLAADKNGNWSAEPSELEIRIKPHWYWSSMMKFIYFIVGVGLLFWGWGVQKRRWILNNQLAFEKSEATRLKDLDEMKSRFFTNVSHELRTPLTLILGPINSLLKSGDLTNKQFTLLKIAQQNGKDILKFVGSILDLSKMESGKLELNNSPVVLFPFIRRTVSNFESYADRSKILFSFEYNIPKNLCFEFDQTKLEIVLNNLLSNALKFTEGEGSVIFKAMDLENVLQFSVEDTGRGIHEKDLPFVFDRFYQSRQSDAPTEGGTGVGLAVSQEYIKLMDGIIRVESEYGKGSTFIVELPRKEILGQVEATLPTENKLQFEVLEKNEALDNSILPKDNSLSTIMIVEDNYGLRKFLNTMLSPHFNTMMAENGQVALEQLTEISAGNQTELRLPDLILSDVMMPKMDGFQLLKKLRLHDDFSHIPMVMLTARADMEDRLKALRIGVDDYLLKPFDEEELLIRIQNLLKNYEVRKSIQLNPEEAEKVKNDALRKKAIAEEDQAWLENLEKTILENLTDSRFNMDFLGDQMAMSRRQLQRKIKKLVGLTPKEYINEIRLHEARHLLQTGEVQMVKVAAYKVGYTDPQYFSAQFKERFGKVPSEYLD